MSVTEADAVIIGSGHNSLACAMHLAVKGWRVAVLEQAGSPGGAVKTSELTLPGFRHDWAAMNLSLFAGSAFFQAHSEELVANGLEFIPCAHPFASVFPDDQWLGISQDGDVNIARLAEFSTNDADAWKQLSADFPQQAEMIFGVLGSSMRLPSIGKLLFGMIRKSGMNNSLDLARFMMSSPRQWLEQTFESEHVKSTLGAWGMHLDFAPDVAGGAVFPYLEAMAGQAFGMVLGKGGADTIVHAMQRSIEARGGTVQCNSSVSRILHQDSKAYAVELEDGTHIKANKVVVANVSPRALLKLTGDVGDARYQQSMTTFVHAPGTMMIHLAMDSLPDWSAGDMLQQFAYVHLAPSLDQMARTYQQARAGLLPDEPVIVCGQPGVVDSDRAPDGKHTLWLQVRMAPGVIAGDAAGQIKATDWQNAAEPFAERALDILERYAPGVRAKIIGRRVVTPQDLESDNPNLVGGDQLCGSHHLSQHFLFRPVRGHTDGSTPIRQLFQTGAAVWPGAGTGAGSGYLLARKLAGG